MSWIKIEYTLLSKPEVMAMAADLGISEFEVTGHLVAFWCWVDANVSLECPRVIGTKSGLDRVCGRAGMVESLIKVGWLIFDGKFFEVPNLDRHLSKGSKQRAVDTRKKQIQRKRPAEETEVCPGNVPIESGQLLSSLILSNQDVSELRSETDSAEKSRTAANHIIQSFTQATGLKAIATKKRIASVRERIRDPVWRDTWMQALEKASQIPALFGDNDRNWKMDIEWFLRPDTVAKILEGKYDNWTRSNQQRKTAAEQREELNASGFDWIRQAAAAEAAASGGEGGGISDSSGAVVLIEKHGATHPARI